MRTGIVILLTSYCFAASAAPFTLNNKTNELSQLKNQITQLKNTINTDKQTQQKLESDLRNTEIKIGDLSQETSKLSTAIRFEQEQLVKLKISQQTIHKKLVEENAALSEQLRAAYQLRLSGSMTVLFNQDNPNTIQRYLTYYKYITQARLQLIQHIEETLASLKKVMLSIITSQQHLKNLLDEKQLEQKQQQLAQNQRQLLLDDLHRDAQTHQQRLTSMVVNQHELQKIITQLQNRLNHAQANTTFQSWRGKLNWPVKGPVIANFDSLLDVGNQHSSGMLIQADAGTPIQAIYAGKIIFANWLRGFGLLIIIDHGNNYMSLYGRNRALYVKLGDHVNTGDMIATIGNSGGFDKTSLYFEIRHNGIPINPNSWCR